MNGNFNNLPVIGHHVAWLQYWCRVTVYYEINKNMNGISDNISDYNKIPELEYVFDGNSNVYSALEEIGRLASSYVLNEPPLPLITWDKFSNKKLKIKGKVISINDISTVAKYSINKVDSILRISMCGFVIDTNLTNNIITDNLQNNSPSYSFIKDSSNNFMNLNDTLLKYFSSKTNLRNRFCSNNADIYKKKILNWLEKTGELVQWLIVAIHLTYGQPSRGTELRLLQIINPTNGMRNLFWINDTIAISTYYNKTNSITQSSKTIIRFLPKNLAELLLRYLIYIRPLEM
jgi:hypothetical protein